MIELPLHKMEAGVNIALNSGRYDGFLFYVII